MTAAQETDGPDPTGTGRPTDTGPRSFKKACAPLCDGTVTATALVDAPATARAAHAAASTRSS